MKDEQRTVAILTDTVTLGRHIAHGLDLPGYNVVTLTSNVPDTIAAIASVQPDVLFVRNNLSNGNGLEICRTLKGSPDTSEIKTVLLSSDPEVIQSAGPSADYGLLVPFAREMVLRVLERLFNPSNTIVFAEDSKSYQDLVAPYLAGRGYRVLQAWNGAEALELIANQEVDLLVTDVEMPEMDGFELARRLRSQEATRNLPIVITSSQDSAPSIRRGFFLKINDYLTKPFALPELLQRIENHLGKSGPGESFRDERLLVVDDNEIARETITHALRYNGFEPEEAVDGETALKLLLRNKYDLLIAAFHMEAMGGRQLLAELRRSEHLQDLPVVIVDINSDTKADLADMVRLESLGIRGFIGKPFNYTTLLVEVERILARERANLRRTS